MGLQERLNSSAKRAVICPVGLKRKNKVHRRPHRMGRHGCKSVFPIWLLNALDLHFLIQQLRSNGPRADWINSNRSAFGALQLKTVAALILPSQWGEPLA